MKLVTIEIGGITQQVPEADLSLYKRAGYSVVDEKPAPVEPVAPVDPDPAPVDPEPSDPEPAEKPARKSK